MEVQWFILSETIVFQGFKGVPSFSKGVNFFRGGGQDANFYSIETYRTYDFPGAGGPDPIPPLDPRMQSCFRV